MSDEEAVFDPLALELSQYHNLAFSESDLEELTTPQSVKMLLEQRTVNLSRLKNANDKIEVQSAENKELIDHIGNLRVELERAKVFQHVSWAEIPISIFSGFAINMLTNNVADFFAWVILVITFFIILFFRLPYFRKKLED